MAESTETLDTTPAEPHPFTTTLPAAVPSPPEARQALDGLVLRLRAKLEHYYCECRRLEDAAAAGQDAADELAQEFYTDLIWIADSFEDMFLQFEENEALREQEVARQFLEMAYGSVEAMLDKRHIYRVPVEGLRYDEVEHDGVAIPEPWKVVGTSGGAGEKSDRRVTKTRRSLWIHEAEGEVRVLRRAEVIC